MANTQIKDIHPVVQIIGAVAFVFVGYKVYRKVFPSGTDRADSEEIKNNQQIVQANKNLLDRYIKLKKPTYSEVTYKGWAEVLYKAMDGNGTNFSTIKNVFGYMASDTDVVKLIDTFGIRNRKGNNPFSSDATPLSLNGWFAEELDATDISIVNQILYTKHIAYRF